MIYIIPLLISFFIGYSLFHLLSDSNDKMIPTDIFLANGLGLGISSQVVFYSLFIFKQLSVTGVIFLHLIILCVLISIRKIKKKNSSFKENIKQDCGPLIWLICIVPFAINAGIFALSRPYGDWDAWGLWNLRANFIFRAGEAWRNIFYYPMEPMRHPWLMPFVVVWNWSVSGKEDFLAPLLVSLIFTFSVIGLLISGLSQYGSYKLAILSGIFLTSTPFFIWHATSQYADIAVAYYTLAGVICILKTMQHDSRKYALLSGLFLGLLSFTKNEGMLISALLLAITLTYILFYKKNLRLIFYGAGSILCIIPSAFITKFILIPHDADKGKLLWSLVLDPQRAGKILDFVMHQVILGVPWGGFWIIALISVIINIKILFQKETKILTFFTLSFFFIVFFYYMVTPHDLGWHLAVSFNRILFQVMPLITYLMFYCFSKHKRLTE